MRNVVAIRERKPETGSQNGWRVCLLALTPNEC